MTEDQRETILLICADELDAASLMTRFYDAGICVIGPIQTARMALALAAQTKPTLDLMAGETTGVRTAAELAVALSTTWGVPSILLDPRFEDPDTAPSWRASEGQTRRVRRLIEAGAGLARPGLKAISGNSISKGGAF